MGLIKWLRGRNGLGGTIRVETELVASHIRDAKEIGKRVVKNRVVTNAGVGYIVVISRWRRPGRNSNSPK